MQLPVTFLNVPVSNLLEFILGSKAERYKAKKKRTLWDRLWGKNISCFFLLFPLASELSIFKDTPWTNLNSHDQCSNAFINPWLLLVYLITTWLRPVSLFQLHYAVQHESKKTLDLFWLFPPSTAEIKIRYTTTSITFEYVVDKLEQSWATFYKEYCQNGAQKKSAGKKYTSGEKTRQEIWVVSMAHVL